MLRATATSWLENFYFVLESNMFCEKDDFLQFRKIWEDHVCCSFPLLPI